MRDIINIRNLGDFRTADLADPVTIEITDHEFIYRLRALNDFLADNDIEVSIDHTTGESTPIADHLWWMDIVPILSNVRRLRITGYGPRIKSIDEIGRVKCLEQLELSANFSASLDLSPLSVHRNTLHSLKMDFGLTDKQTAVIKELQALRDLQCYRIELEKLPVLGNLESLSVRSAVKDVELIVDRIPGLESLFLKRCGTVTKLDSIAKLPHLTSLSLWWMGQLTAIPEFSRPSRLKAIQAVGLINLHDISGLFTLKNLEILMLTGLEKLRADDFTRLRELGNLKVAYVTFKDSRENDKFIEFATSNNWIYCQPVLAGS